MKKLIYPTLVVMIGLFITTNLSAQKTATPLQPGKKGRPTLREIDVFLGGGYKAPYATMFIGVRIDNFGFSFGGDTSGDKKPDAKDYTIPHTDYDLERFNNGNNSIDVYYFQQLFTDFYIYPAIGLTYSITNIFAHSNATGWYYEHDKESKWGFTYGGGLRVVIDYISIGAGWHNILGANLQVGYVFKN